MHVFIDVRYIYMYTVYLTLTLCSLHKKHRWWFDKPVTAFWESKKLEIPLIHTTVTDLTCS